MENWEKPTQGPEEEEYRGPFNVTYKAEGGGLIYNPYSGTTTEYDDHPVYKGGYITGATAYTPDGYVFDTTPYNVSDLFVFFNFRGII